MRCCLILVCLFFVSSLNAQSLSTVRKEYYEAINSSKATNKLYGKLVEAKPVDPLIMAYLGSAQALKARFSWNPYNKLAYLSEGLKTLGDAVNKSPRNLEIRFLRFSLVHYLPAFLGYGNTLGADKEMIVDLIRNRKYGLIDATLLKSIIGFMKETKHCTKEEIALLNNAVSNG